MSTALDWTTELREAFRSSKDLETFLGWPLHHATSESYPVFVTRYLADLIKSQGPDRVLARQFLPHEDELNAGGLMDPIGDTTHAKSGQLIHRYENRALLIPTTICPVQCRYCFRKNELHEGTFQQDRETTLNYLQNHPAIEEVIFTGGDPFILSDEKIASWLELIAQIEHVRWIRFHTRVPVILPSRLTSGLKAVLQKFSQRFEKVIVIVHSNHVSEWTPVSRQAVRDFQIPEIEWLCQSVLLKGVNDSPETLLELFRQLVQDRIRPYYLHHPDQVKGAMHFWLSLEEGRRIWSTLHNNLPGWALPQYIIDIPGGHGKVQAFNPETHAFSGRLLDRYGSTVESLDHATRT